MNSTGLQPTTATGTTSRGYGNTGVPKELHSSRVDSDRDDRAARVGASLDATTTGSSGLGSSTAADVVAGATDGISGTSGTQTGAQTGATGTNTGMTGVNATSANPISTSGPVDRVAGAGVFGHASHVQDLSVTAGDSTAQQNDTRDPADPSTHPANAAPMKNVDNTTGGLDTGDNPVKVDGPGPKPVAILARERGGDAGNVNADASGADLGEPQIGAPGAGSDAAAGQIQHEGGHAKDPAEGEYVKSTGLAADGGDFDATRPGAGAEADRELSRRYPVVLIAT